MRMIPITTHKMSLIILSSHLLYVCMLLATECPLQKSKNDLRSWPGHQKTVLWSGKKDIVWIKTHLSMCPWPNDSTSKTQFWLI